MTYPNPMEITEDQFDAHYPLITNHLNQDAGWVTDDGPGCLFETYGEELAFVRQQALSNVWTLLAGDDGEQYLASGFHLVNRIGYLVSSVAAPRGAEILVKLAA